MEADVNLDCALPSCQPIKRFQSANSDRKIILTTIFAEAKSESIEGQQWVIKNRTDIHSYWSGPIGWIFMDPLSLSNGLCLYQDQFECWIVIEDESAYDEISGWLKKLSQRKQIRLSMRKDAFASQCRKLHDVLRNFASKLYVGFDIRTLLPIMEIHNVINRIERELVEQQVTSVDKLLHLFGYIMPSKDRCAIQKLVEIFAETGHSQLSQCLFQEIAAATGITENNTRICNGFINQATDIDIEYASVPSSDPIMNVIKCSFLTKDDMLIY